MTNRWLGGSAERKAVSAIAERSNAWGDPARSMRPETSRAGIAEGVAAGTLIATSVGWRPVEAITKGDRVLTFDNGLQAVTHIRRGTLWTTGRGCPRNLWPVGVPVNVLGNRKPMLLLPEQFVLVESDVAEELYGDPFALVPAGSLIGYRGIASVTPRKQVDVISLGFRSDEILYANGSALLHCTNAAVAKVSTPEEMMHHGPRNPYLRLSRESLAHLVQCLKEEDRAGAAASAAPVAQPQAASARLS